MAIPRPTKPENQLKSDLETTWDAIDAALANNNVRLRAASDLPVLFRKEISTVPAARSNY